jgi:hypothetical protein
MNSDFGLIQHELKNPNKSAQKVIEDIQKSPLLLESLICLVSAKDPTFQKNSKNLTVLASLTNLDSLPENLKIDPADITKLFSQIAPVEKTTALSENEFVVTMESPIAAHLCKLAFDGLHIQELGVRFDVEETPDASLFNYGSDRIVKTPEINTILQNNENLNSNIHAEESSKPKANGLKEKHRLKNNGKEFTEMTKVNDNSKEAQFIKNFPSLTVGKPTASIHSSNSNVNKLLNNEPLAGDNPNNFDLMSKFATGNQINIPLDKTRRFSTNSDYDNHSYYQTPNYGFGDDQHLRLGNPMYNNQDPRFFKLITHNQKEEGVTWTHDAKTKGQSRHQNANVDDFEVDYPKLNGEVPNNRDETVIPIRKNSLKSKVSKLSLQKTQSTHIPNPSTFKPMTWPKEEENSIESDKDLKVDSNENSVNEASQHWPLPNGIRLTSTKSMLPQVPNSHYMFNNPSNKFTCRYDVVIENEKNFQIAKKIIGSKGCNMKNIIENSLGEAGLRNHPNSKEAIKLRLRGKGSGFLEGPERKESDETLHLCVSAKNHGVFNITCRHVETLLSKIYEEYVQYQKKNGNEQVCVDNAEVLEGFKFRKHEPVHGQFYF